MAVYAVFEPPLKKRSADVDVLTRAERFKFVRDGFSWAAFLFGPVWMLCYRLWLALICYCVAAFAIAAAATWFDLADGAATLASLLVALLIGFEATTLRRRKLLFWRWQDAGVVVGRNYEAAERRFFDRWIMAARTGSAEPAAATLATETSAPPVHAAESQAPESHVSDMFPSQVTLSAPPESKP